MKKRIKRGGNGMRKRKKDAMMRRLRKWRRRKGR
jgi:hypothetical protein